MRECECEIPLGSKRCCERCGNFLSRSSEEIGRLHTRMDAAIHSLGLDEVELRHFIRKMNETLPTDIKHKFSTWSHNRMVERSGMRA